LKLLVPCSFIHVHTLCDEVLHFRFEAARDTYRDKCNVESGLCCRQAGLQRAMANGTKFGRQVTEAAWQRAEVDAVYRLAAAGVRVPMPHNFSDSLLELVTGALPPASRPQYRP